MDGITINLWGVLLGAVSSMVIGAIYYSPQLYGKLWISAGKIDEKRYHKEMGKLMPVVFAGALLTSYFVAYFSILYHAFFGDTWLAASFVTSLLLFVGVSATTVFVHSTLDQRPKQLTWLTLGNRFLSLVVIGLIVGWLHP